MKTLKVYNVTELQAFLKRRREEEKFNDSSRIPVTHNRRAMEPLGSLSPDLLMKLNKKHRFQEDERNLGSDPVCYDAVFQVSFACNFCTKGLDD